MTRPALLFAGAAALLAPMAAQAQSDPIESVPGAEQAETADMSSEVPVYPIRPDRRPEQIDSSTNGSQAGVRKPGISVIGSSGDTDVSLTFGINPDKEISGGQQSFGSLTVNAPLDDDSGIGALPTEQGIPHKAGVDFSYTWILGGSVDRAARLAGPLEEKFVAGCRAWVTGLPSYRKHEFEYWALDREYNALARAPQSEDLKAKLAVILEKRDAENQAMHDMLEKGCASGKSVWDRKPELLARFLNEEDRRMVGRALDQWNNSTVTIINLAGGVGYRKFDYLDPIGFGEESAKKTSYYASASIGFSFSSTSPFLGFGYQYRRDYDEAKKRVICPTGGSGATTECKYAVFDGPDRNIDHGAFALIRAPLGDPRKKGLVPVVELKGAYDFEDKVFSAALPIYFILDKDGALKGGARFDWKSKVSDPEEDKLRFSFFIVKSFDFMGF